MGVEEFNHIEGAAFAPVIDGAANGPQICLPEAPDQDFSFGVAANQAGREAAVDVEMAELLLKVYFLLDVEEVYLDRAPQIF